MKTTLIIGGGAAGMAAAIAAARKGEHVTVLDRNRKVLKKLGVTGNGRGNLLNCGEPAYYGDADFAHAVLSHMPYAQVAAFLEDCGIPLVEEAEGRMYPASFLAASAVDALKLQAERLGVSIHVNTRATGVEKLAQGGFLVRCLRALYEPETRRKSGKVKPGALLGEEPCEYRADRVILAVGGAAAPMHGTDGSSYELFTALGHQLEPVHPALSALITETQPLVGLSGQRVRGRFALGEKAGQCLHESMGEALFADDGVSGIAMMQLSRFAHDGCTLCMDLRLSVAGDAQADTQAWLLRRARLFDDPAQLLVGACTPALAQALWRMSGHAPSLAPDALSALADAIEHFCLPVRGTRSFESAQVTAGGIRCDFDPATMESRFCPGLYAAGEALDVDGACGGYNLMFAFASGLLAGKAN